MNEAQSICDLNNQGAAFLDAGCFENAIRKFAEALQLSRRVLPFIAGGTCLLSEVDSIDSMMNKPVVDQEFESRGIGRCYVYSHPIRISGIHQPTTAADYTVTTSILIFNLAISHHFRATSMQTNNEAIFQKAAHFYQLGLKLQETKGGCGWEYFAAASLNNLGIVFRKLGQNDESSICFRLLLGSLAHVTAVHQTRNAESPVNERRTYEIFNQNAIFYFLVDDDGTAVAPAA